MLPLFVMRPLRPNLPSSFLFSAKRTTCLYHNSLPSSFPIRSVYSQNYYSVTKIASSACLSPSLSNHKLDHRNKTLSFQNRFISSQALNVWKKKDERKLFEVLQEPLIEALTLEELNEYIVIEKVQDLRDQDLLNMIDSKALLLQLKDSDSSDNNFQKVVTRITDSQKIKPLITFLQALAKTSEKHKIVSDSPLTKEQNFQRLFDVGWEPKDVLAAQKKSITTLLRSIDLNQVRKLNDHDFLSVVDLRKLDTLPNSKGLSYLDIPSEKLEAIESERAELQVQFMSKLPISLKRKLLIQSEQNENTEVNRFRFKRSTFKQLEKFKKFQKLIEERSHLMMKKNKFIELLKKHISQAHMIATGIQTCEITSTKLDEARVLLKNFGFTSDIKTKEPDNYERRIITKDQATKFVKSVVSQPLEKLSLEEISKFLKIFTSLRRIFDLPPNPEKPKLPLAETAGEQEYMHLVLQRIETLLPELYSKIVDDATFEELDPNAEDDHQDEIPQFIKSSSELQILKAVQEYNQKKTELWLEEEALKQGSDTAALEVLQKRKLEMDQQMAALQYEYLMSTATPEEQEELKAKKDEILNSEPEIPSIPMSPEDEAEFVHRAKKEYLSANEPIFTPALPTTNAERNVQNYFELEEQFTREPSVQDISIFDTKVSFGDVIGGTIPIESPLPVDDPFREAETFDVASIYKSIFPDDPTGEDNSEYNWLQTTDNSSIHKFSSTDRNFENQVLHFKEDRELRKQLEKDAKVAKIMKRILRASENTENQVSTETEASEENTEDDKVDESSDNLEDNIDEEIVQLEEEQSEEKQKAGVDRVKEIMSRQYGFTQNTVTPEERSSVASQAQERAISEFDAVIKFNEQAKAEAEELPGPAASFDKTSWSDGLRRLGENLEDDTEAEAEAEAEAEGEGEGEGEQMMNQQEDVTIDPKVARRQYEQTQNRIGLYTEPGGETTQQPLHVDGCELCVSLNEESRLDPMNYPYLMKFLHMDGSIKARKKTKLCRRHQKKMAKAVKRATALRIFRHTYSVFFVDNPFDDGGRSLSSIYFPFPAFKPHMPHPNNELYVPVPEDIEEARLREARINQARLEQKTYYENVDEDEEQELEQEELEQENEEDKYKDPLGNEIF